MLKIWNPHIFPQATGQQNYKINSLARLKNSGTYYITFSDVMFYSAQVLSICCCHVYGFQKIEAQKESEIAFSHQRWLLPIIVLPLDLIHEFDLGEHGEVNPLPINIVLIEIREFYCLCENRQNFNCWQYLSFHKVLVDRKMFCGSAAFIIK